MSDFAIVVLPKKLAIARNLAQILAEIRRCRVILLNDLCLATRLNSGLRGNVGRTVRGFWGNLACIPRYRGFERRNRGSGPHFSAICR